jgi:two-component system sensor histidine kinase YesM
MYTPGMPDHPLGFFWIDLSLKRIQEICEQIRFGKSGYLMIIDNSAKVIFHPKTNYIGVEYPFGFRHKILAEQSGSFLTDIEGEKSLVVFDTTSDTDWRVVAVVPYSEIGSGVLRLRSITSLMIVICIVASIILSIMFAATITRPIKKLQQTMAEASQGYLDLSIPVERTDEIGKLTANFNQMLMKIKTLIDDNYTAKLREANAEVKHHQAELRALQAQINPHFLYNTLGTISSLAELEGVGSISRMAGSLADFFRYSIHTDDIVVTLRDELAQVKRYFSIQKLRFADRIELSVDIPETLLDQPIIKLTLQPIVENACIHGLELYGSGRISITSRIDREYLTIMISDNGSGIPVEELNRIQHLLDHPEDDPGENKIGIGLRNVHSRLKLHYGEKYGIHIKSREGEGTTVMVLLPCEFHPNND